MMRCDICERDLTDSSVEDIFSCQECGKEVCCDCISCDFLTCVDCAEEL